MRVRCPKCGKKMKRSYRDPFLVTWSCEDCNLSLILQYGYDLELRQVGLYISLFGVALQTVAFILLVTIGSSAWLPVWLEGAAIWGIGMFFLERKVVEEKTIINWNNEGVKDERDGRGTA